MRKWYVLYVNVRHEKKVTERLLEKGLEAYAPMVKKMKQWSDRKKEIEEPLFTGYVFIKLLPHELDLPRFIPGVINYLSFEKKPAYVRDREIEGLKFFIGNGYYLESEENTFQPGDKAILNLGDFRNIHSEVEQIINDEYVYVSFEGVKKNIRLRAPVRALKPLKK